MIFIKVTPFALNLHNHVVEKSIFVQAELIERIEECEHDLIGPHVTLQFCHGARLAVKETVAQIFTQIFSHGVAWGCY